MSHSPEQPKIKKFYSSEEKLLVEQRIENIKSNLKDKKVIAGTHADLSKEHLEKSLEESIKELKEMQG